MLIALLCKCLNSRERIAKRFQKWSQKKCPSFRSYLGLWVHKTISCLRCKVIWYLLFVVLIFNLQRFFSQFCLSIQMLHGTFHLKGAFTNYVDKFWFLFDHLPPSVDIFWLMNVDKNWHFLTTYPPSFVNVVCECPPTEIW